MRHVGVDDTEDAVGRRRSVEAERLSDVLLDCLPHAFVPQPERAAGECVGVEIAEDEVRVGHRGVASAAAVADGPGLRASALGADMERARHDAGDGAATRADALHVDRGQANEITVSPVPERLDGGPASPYQADVVAGAAHVDGDEVLDAGRARHVAGTGHSARGTAADDRDGLASHVLRSHNAAVGEHDEQVVGEAGAAELARQHFEVAAGCAARCRH